MAPPSDSDIREEQTLFANVVTTFERYGSYALAANNRRRKDMYKLSQADQKLLDELGWKNKLSEVDEAIMANDSFVKQIVAEPQIFSGEDLAEDDGGEGEDGALDEDMEVSHGTHPHSHSEPHSHSHSHSHSTINAGVDYSHHSHSGSSKSYRPTDFDMDKLRSTLKQFVRDWSLEGKLERDLCYEPIKEALLKHFSHVADNQRGELRVLVPGAGLGRLAYDVARLGFACQGNEFSHYMLLASFFILNRTNQINQHTIFPHVHSFSNIPNHNALLRPVKIPDVLPSDLPAGSKFSLVAGDFEEVYGAEDGDKGNEPQSGKWDAVLTCFFIDTAKNIINYLRIIHKILTPGGVWINIGPLLWHWENNTTNDPSIELDLEEVKTLCRKIGFEISNERTIDTTYTNNSQAMLGYTYHAAFWTATKVKE